jgi:hypothetical protein
VDGEDGSRGLIRKRATRWVSFVEGNPIRYTDPSGQMTDEPGSNLPFKVKPNPWIYLWVNHAAELDRLNRSGPEAQYIPVPSSYYYPNKSDKPIHYNLCGHLSFAAIY